MRKLIAVTALAAALAGCQSTEQMRYSADETCRASGLRSGTRAYTNCMNANIRQSQRNNDAVATAVVAGAAAGLVGAAIVASADRPYYYGGGYYGRRYYRSGYYRYCDAWGCY